MVSELQQRKEGERDRSSAQMGPFALKRGQSLFAPIGSRMSERLEHEKGVGSMISRKLFHY
jgi:hypothetical protein